MLLDCSREFMWSCQFWYLIGRRSLIILNLLRLEILRELVNFAYLLQCFLLCRELLLKCRFRDLHEVLPAQQILNIK